VGTVRRVAGLIREFLDGLPRETLFQAPRPGTVLQGGESGRPLPPLRPGVGDCGGFLRRAVEGELRRTRSRDSGSGSKSSYSKWIHGRPFGVLPPFRVHLYYTPTHAKPVCVWGPVDWHLQLATPIARSVPFKTANRNKQMVTTGGSSVRAKFPLEVLECREPGRYYFLWWSHAGYIVFSQLPFG